MIKKNKNLVKKKFQMSKMSYFNRWNRRKIHKKNLYILHIQMILYKKMKLIKI